MSAPRTGSTMIEGRVARTSRSLEITFHSGPGDPLAVAVRGDSGRTARMAAWLGFHTAGTGTHRITYSNGTTLLVRSRTSAPTLLTRSDGTAIATISRASTSTAVAGTAGTLFHFVPAPKDAETPALFRLHVLDRMGEKFARLNIVRAGEGPTPFLGTRLLLCTPPDATERDILVAVCVDIALGLRPYITAMK
ncbi:hypothetical protein ACWIGI_21115 [Nocardia sp. NPDC055321]